jgi:site-specific DNA recombinase
MRIKKCEADINSLVGKLTQPDVGEALLRQVNAKVEELSAEQERLIAERDRLQENVNALSDRELQLDAIASALSSLKTYYKELTIPEKRTLIKMLVQKIEWDGQDIHIFIYGE